MAAQYGLLLLSKSMLRSNTLMMINAMDNATHTERRSAFSIFGGLIKFAFIATTLCLIIAGGFLIGGFLKFTDTVTSYETSAKVKNASAIVVFTGGNSRIDEAVKLLKDGKGQRLLISGVHQKISKKTLQKKFHIEENLFNCCVDIDKQAANTHGNAIETEKWSASHKFDSLIIVTSTYHMPRSLLETQRRLPGVSLTPYPVPTTGFDNESWYKDQLSMNILLSEYTKYVATQIKPVLADNTIDTIRASLTSF